MSLLLKFETAACVKQALVTPKTFPKKKHKVSAYAKSSSYRKKKNKDKQDRLNSKCLKYGMRKAKKKKSAKF